MSRSNGSTGSPLAAARAVGYRGYRVRLMTNRPLRDDEREDIARIQASLYTWAFEDIKCAASEAVELPRLAFIGLASWVDAVARLYTGKRKAGKAAWAEFIRAYLPTELH